MKKSKSYWGSLNLTEIKNAIDSGVKPYKGQNADYLNVTIYVNEEPDQYGNSVSVSAYDKESKKAFYLGNFKLNQA